MADKNAELSKRDLQTLGHQVSFFRSDFSTSQPVRSSACPSTDLFSYYLNIVVEIITYLLC